MPWRWLQLPVEMSASSPTTMLVQRALSVNPFIISRSSFNSNFPTYACMDCNIDHTATSSMHCLLQLFWLAMRHFKWGKLQKQGVKKGCKNQGSILTRPAAVVWQRSYSTSNPRRQSRWHSKKYRRMCLRWCSCPETVKSVSCACATTGAHIILLADCNHPYKIIYMQQYSHSHAVFDNILQAHILLGKNRELVQKLALVVAQTLGT